VDFGSLRADGYLQLNIRATITTDDGATIALVAVGVAYPSAGPIVPLRKYAQLTTAAPEYAWVDQLQVWMHDSADMSAGTLHWTAYAS
jgi:hypothetical protein